MGSSGCDAPADAALLRSLLFVPGDSEKKLARALETDADALILDLEDSVVPERKAMARGLVAECLYAPRSPASRMQLWVRVNAPSTPELEADLAAVVVHRPQGLVVPKVRAIELIPLAAALDELEQHHGVPAGSTRLLPTATETPASLLSMDGYTEAGPRLAALTWGAEDLSAALGAATAVAGDGSWLPVYELARALCLLAAHAAGVAAIDTVYTDFRDARGLCRQALEARRDGFTGKLAIHPDQIEIIHEAFSPTREELDEARRVVEAFEGTDSGVVALDGRMLDRPHLSRAERLLALAARFGLHDTGPKDGPARR